MTWVDWICNLAVSLELQAEDRYREFLLAGGNRKDYKGFVPGTDTDNDIDNAMAQFSKATGHTPTRRPPTELAAIFGPDYLQEVVMIDGEYFDPQTGQRVSGQNQIYIPDNAGSG